MEKNMNQNVKVSSSPFQSNQHLSGSNISGNEANRSIHICILKVFFVLDKDQDHLIQKGLALEVTDALFDYSNITFFNLLTIWKILGDFS